MEAKYGLLHLANSLTYVISDNFLHTASCCTMNTRKMPRLSSVGRLDRGHSSRSTVFPSPISNLNESQVLS
ncbi:hypothetical protein AAHA92_21289 [Salvia divinorum]|uniref:Uncharacterized protein n=1 Tax=Salvia divinorum TaxID=28513 RepID=A0ABD1GJZ2_SALDI